MKRPPNLLSRLRGFIGKGTICFDGRPDRVRNQMGVRVAFQHLSGIPTRMPASKCGIAHGLLPGHFVSCADAEKAYCQSPFKGTPTCIELPFDMRPPEWHGRFPKADRPVVPLEKNLYGHPQAGPLYERWAAEQLFSIGFKPVENWLSVFFQESTRCLLILYVDDFILSGPEKFKSAVHKQIGSVIEVGGWSGLGRYLGCHHQVADVTDGRFKGSVRIRFLMKDYLLKVCSRYKQLTGIMDFKYVTPRTWTCIQCPMRIGR